MALHRYASILVGGLTLLGCVLLAEEPRRVPGDNKKFYVFSVTLPPIPGKPLSIKSRIDITWISNSGKATTTRAAEDLVRDSEGRVYRHTHGFIGESPAQSSPSEAIYLIDAAATSQTVCWTATKKCLISAYHPGRESCTDLTGPDRGQISWSNLGEYSLAGITVIRTRETCNPGGAVDFWHNSELELDLHVIADPTPPVGFPKIDHQITDISRSEPDPKMFQVPSGYTLDRQQ
jgi:hypothetical protein